VQRILSRDAGSAAAAAPRPAALAALALAGVLAGAALVLAGPLALALAAALLGCAFILVDFRVGVVLLIVLMPLSRSAYFPHAMFGVTGLNPVNLLLAATLGACLLQALGDGSWRRFVPAPMFWLYLAPLLLAGLHGLRHADGIVPAFYVYGLIQFDAAAGYFRDMVAKPLLMAVFALLVAAAVARSARPEGFLLPAGVAMAVMGAMVPVYVAASGAGLHEISGSGARGFLSGVGLHANELGRLYTIAYALLLFTWAQTTGTRPRLLLLAAMGLATLALLLTFSRGAFVAFALVNVLFLLWRRNAQVLLLGLPLAVAALFALPEAVYERLGAGFGGGLNAISAGRIDGLWLPLVPDFLRSPFVGSGLGSILWSDAMRQAGTGGVLGATHPHNAYLEILLDMGLIGLALVCAYFAHVWRSFRALAADPALAAPLRGFFQGAAAGLVAYLVSGLTDSSLAPRTEQAFLWLAIGLMYGVRAKQAAAA
jgi:hypothetical protein